MRFTENTVMPRIALSIVTLFLVTSSALIAANDNPFSRWESLKKHTDPVTETKSAAVEKKAPAAKPGAVAYFSPTESAAAPKAAAPVVNTDAAAKVTRERLSTGAPKAGSQVKTANFSGTPAKGAIQKVSGDFLTDFGGQTIDGSEPNPFEEFLGPAAGGQETQSVAIPELPPEFDLDEPQPAETASFDGSVPPQPYDFTTDGFGDTQGQPTAITNTRTPANLNGPQTPSVTLQWVLHGEFTLGQECRCDLVVENTGRTPVRNVVAEALLPEGMQVMKADPAPSDVTDSASWTFGELAAGEKRTIELVVVPQQQGDANVSAFVRMTGASVSTFAVTQPQLAVQVDGPANVEIGQQVNYTIAVGNPGSGIARNVVIQAAIPEGLEHRQGGMLSIEIGTLNPGEQRRARLSVTGTKGGEHSLSVRVVGDGGLTKEVTEAVAVAEPKLNIGVRGAAVVQSGQIADYELIVVNEGRVDSSNVRAKYRVPAGFEFVKADLGGKFNAADNTINWFVGTLEPNQVRNLQVALRPTTTGAARHQVGVISEHGKMTVADHDTVVQGSADLTLQLVSDRNRAAAGALVSYEVKVNNVGQSAANHVGVSFELPPGLELIKITAPSEYISDNGVVIFRSMPELEAGKSVTITVQAKCKRAGRHRVRVRVASESIQEALIEESTVAGQ